MTLQKALMFSLLVLTWVFIVAIIVGMLARLAE